VKAVNKATDYLSLKKAGGAGRGGAEDYFFIKCESRYEKIAYADVLFAEAMQNYVLIHTTRRKYISYLTFKSVEENLPGQLFLKVHKSFIVSFSKIDSVESNEIRIGEHAIPVSRSNREEILNSILQNKLIRR
jgi:DNA-binding LytR/AlgR family response regulator